MIIPSSFKKTGGAERQLYILKEKLKKKNKIYFLTNELDKNKILFLLKIFIYIILNKKKIDLVHIHTINSPALIGSLAAKLIGKPVIVKIPRNGLNSSINLYNKNNLGKLYLFSLKKTVSKFICLTKFAEKELKSFGFKKEKLIVIPNGVEITQDKSIKKNKNFNHYVFAGRLIKRKKIDEIIQAFKKIFKNKKKKLFIIGEGPELKKLQQLDSDIPSISKVFFLGNKNNAFVQKQFEKCAFFIMNSTSEGLSNSLLEAMSKSCVVIVRKIKGIDEILKDNRNSIIFRNKNELIKKLKNYNNYKKLIDISENAFMTINKSYNINFIADRYIDLYKKLIN